MKQGRQTPLNFVLSIGAALLIQGCDSGSSVNSESPPSNQGVLLDSAVHGINYRTSSGRIGTTGPDGEFLFNANDKLSFSIGSLVLDEVQAKPVMTPLDLFGTANPHDPRVVNFVRLIQTLDDDGDISEAINLPAGRAAALEAIDLTNADLNRTPAEFATLPSVQKLLASMLDVEAMVPKDEALAHFIGTLSSSDKIDSDGDGIANSNDIDDDNDGTNDAQDTFPWDAAESTDYDEDGIGDNADQDDDGDGATDENDAFPLNANEIRDTDGDGTGDNADTDDDNDGIPDVSDPDPLGKNEDFDGDGIDDESDEDDDNDGVADSDDAFPKNAAESADYDSDGTGDNADTDDDNDGIDDKSDAFPHNSNESADHDSDGTGDNADTDDDNDGVEDSSDAFPFNAGEHADHDNDGIGDIADTDDDNDGVADNNDAFPLDASENADFDADGTGNNADNDDDNDGITDNADAFPLDNSEHADNDNDGTGDNADSDDDNDGITDNNDAFPLDASENKDTDNDGTGNVADTDDDNDGVSDEFDKFPLDAAESTDFDNDGIGDNSDTDDDNDGVADSTDSLLQMQISVTNLPPAADHLYHRELELLFITHKAEKQISVLNTANGELLQTFDFDLMPERMALSPDGQELYVALLTQEHSSYWWDEDQSGAIAVITTADLSIDRTLTIDQDPYDLVVTSNGKLIVSTGSGQWTSIQAYNAQTGVILGTAFIRQASRISLHPSENWVFAANTDSSPSDIEKFDISGVGILAVTDSPYHGDHRMDGNVWATPDALHLITRGGDVFLASDMSYVKSLDLGESTTMIDDVVFDHSADLAHLQLTDEQSKLLHLTSMEIISSTDHVGSVSTLYDQDGAMFYLTTNLGQSQLIKTPHPCPDCSTNTTPMASFSYIPLQGDTSTPFHFDATASSDAENASTLLYRWDADGDGQWDNEFNSESQIEHQYVLAGTKAVTLQVKDVGGLTHTIFHSFVVAQGSNKGQPKNDSAAFSLDYEATATQIDTARKRMYVTDKAAGRLYVLDMDTGLTERFFELPGMPQNMTISPDGSTLYVAVLKHEHSSFRWEEDQSGYIAEFDLALLEHTRTIDVAVDPYDLLVTSKGKLIISSGSGQWSSIFAYDALTGTELGKASISQKTKLNLHPSENWVFAADTESSPSDIEKFDISGAGITSLGDSPYHGEHRMDGNVWSTPDGKHLITRGGDVFLASDMSYVHSLDLGSSEYKIEQLFFDDAANIAHLTLSSQQVVLLNLNSMESFSPSLVNPARFGLVSVYELNGSVYYLETSSGNLRLIEAQHPCPECSSNTAPVASFSYSQISNSNTYSFSSTSNDVEGGILKYRWDADGDGEWDSGFRMTPGATRTYILNGNKQVSLQVQDTGGLTSTISHSFTFTHQSNLGYEINDSTPYVIDYTATAKQVDSARSLAYITDKDAKRLYVLNTNTGLTERVFVLPAMPESMALSPSGNTLYVALLKHEHSYYRWKEEQSGYIAVFDLEQLAHTHNIGVDVDPYDLLVTSQDKLIVSSGSGQWSNIYAYDAVTGAELGNSSIWQSSTLSLHPSENWVFAADNGLSPSDIEKFDISGTGITSIGDSPYHGDHRMDGGVWATPDGLNLITKGGDVFLASDMSFVESLTASQLGIQDLSFNTSEQSMFLLGTDGVIYRYDSITRQLTGNNAEHTDTLFLLETTNGLYVATGAQGSIELSLVQF